MSTPTAQDLRRRIATAAIEAAEARLALYDRFGWEAPNRAELLAAVTVDALSWFEMDHDDAWDEDTWAESADSAIEYLSAECVAGIIRRALPEDARRRNDTLN